MYFHDILRQLQDLRKKWRNQDFRYTREQKEQYEMLVELRRARVAQLYEEGRFSATKAKSRKVEEEI
jgi:hypothetical protein